VLKTKELKYLKNKTNHHHVGSGGKKHFYHCRKDNEAFVISLSFVILQCIVYNFLDKSIILRQQQQQFTMALDRLWPRHGKPAIVQGCHRILSILHGLERVVDDKSKKEAKKPKHEGGFGKPEDRNPRGPHHNEIWRTQEANNDTIVKYTSPKEQIQI